MRKYLAFFKIAFKKSLEYRGRGLIWFVWDIGPAIIMLFFWQAVFQTREQVAGYDFASLVLYYFVVMLARSLVLTHPDEALQQEILTGQINVYLPRPADLILLKFFNEIAYKLLRILFLIPVALIGYFLFLKGRQFSFELSFFQISFFLLSSGLSFCFYYLFRILIGLTSFWFTEIDWLSSFQDLAFWFFGGLLLPLDLFPRFFQSIADILPFKYVFYLPSQGLLGRLSFPEMLFSLLVQVFWLVLFFLLVKRTYRLGLKIYSAFGG